MMNKVGSAFAVGMTLVMMFLVGYSWWCFSVANNKIESGMTALDNLTSIYDASERLALYFEGSARLSSQHAFYEIAKLAAVKGEKCFTKPYNGRNIVEWTDLCKPDNVKELFLDEYNKSMKFFIDSYPEKIDLDGLEFSTAFENNMIISTAKKTFTAQQQAAYAKYNLSYEMLLKAKVNLTEEQIYLDDFLLIYNSCVSAIAKCKQTEQAELETCLEKTSFERWAFNATLVRDWVLFEFRTKKPFFFKENNEEKFSPIKLNFGLSL